MTPNQNLTIMQKDLAPFNSYQIRVAVFYLVEENRYNRYNASAIYQVVNLYIPSMTIQYDPNILALPINLNLEQQFFFDYSLVVDPDYLMYSANIFYNFALVTTVIYQYPIVNFRIWDYFEGFS